MTIEREREQVGFSLSRAIDIVRCQSGEKTSCFKSRSKKPLAMASGLANLRLLATRIIFLDYLFKRDLLAFLRSSICA
jgi:hypothetical protein